MANILTIRNELFTEAGKRKVKLLLAPRGNLRYTLDGSEARNSTHEAPITISDKETRIWVFAEEDGIEGRAEFSFPARGKKKVEIDDTKPAILVAARGVKNLDSRQKVYSGLDAAKEKTVDFEDVSLFVGQAGEVCVAVSSMTVGAEYLTGLLESSVLPFDVDAPITLSFKKAHFKSGHDLKQFTSELGIDVQPGEVVQ